jgi:hypothetical protein
MFSFRCEWCGEPMGEDRSGLELGHMTFAGPRGECTSRTSPRLAMMMGPSVVTLLDGLERLLTGKQIAFDFSAVASSFSVYFERVRRGRIAIRYRKIVVGEVDEAELHAAVLSGVQAFFPQEGNELCEDVGRAELASSIQAFTRLFPSRR